MKKTNKLMVAVPCMDMMQSLTAKSLCGLALNAPPGTLYQFAIGSLVYDARNQIVEDAIARGVDRILWIDSDMVFEPDLYARLGRDMDKTGADVVCALYVGRRQPAAPVIWQELDAVDVDGVPHIRQKQFLDYPADSLFPVAGCGFGAALVHIDICKAMMETGLPFSPLPGLGEDLSFCFRARQLGAKIYCDSSVKVGHIGQIVFDESDYQLLRMMGDRNKGQ